MLYDIYLFKIFGNGLFRQGFTKDQLDTFLNELSDETRDQIYILPRKENRRDNNGN